MPVVSGKPPLPDEPYRSIQRRLYHSDRLRLEDVDSFVRAYEPGEFWPKTADDLPGLDALSEIEVGWMSFKQKRLRTRRPHPSGAWVTHDGEAAACWEEREPADESSA